MTIETIRTRIESAKWNSAWNRGVKAYALDLLDDLEELISGGYFSAADLTDKALVKKALLNGADNWKQYSWGGCSLIYDEDIALRLCTPSELKKTKNGQRRPNNQEDWLDTQARALQQAYWRIMACINSAR